MTHRTKQEVLETHIAILEGVAAGERVMDIRQRLGATKESLNDDIIRLKRAGYLAGDGRSGGLRVVKMLERDGAPPSHIKKTRGRNATRADKSIRRRRTLERNGSDAGDPDVFAILNELADPNGLRIIALFDPTAVGKALKAGYVRREDEVALELTDAGREALGLPVLTQSISYVDTPPARIPVKTPAISAGMSDRRALIRLAQRLATELAAALEQLERDEG